MFDSREQGTGCSSACSRRLTRKRSAPHYPFLPLCGVYSPVITEGFVVHLHELRADRVKVRVELQHSRRLQQTARRHRNSDVISELWVQPHSNRLLVPSSEAARPHTTRCIEARAAHGAHSEVDVCVFPPLLHQVGQRAVHTVDRGTSH